MYLIINEKKNCNHFPFITSLIENIPTLSSAQISIMEPKSKLKTHIDDTSAIVRIHLGITIPDTYPNIDFRMNGKEICWKEGEILILSPVKPHYAWNNTNHHRIVFIVDVFHKQYIKNKFLISGRVIAQLIMKIIVSKFKFLKNYLNSLLILYTVH